MLSVACVGCGAIMHEHYKHLTAQQDVRLVGHCDADKARAEAAAGRFGGDAFTEYEAMYDKAKPDAVYVAVPPFAHTGMEEAAAARGIALFIETPLALERARAKQIAAAVRKTKVLTSVGYCFRYYDTVARAREILKGKAVSLVCGCWSSPMPDGAWQREMNKSGGQVLVQTTLLIDLVRYLCGEIAEVYAAGSTGCTTKNDHYDVHDSSVLSLRLKSGATCSIASSCVANHGGKLFLEVITPEATLLFSRGQLIVQEDQQTTEYRPAVDIYAEENGCFLEAVRTGKKNKVRSVYADALKTFLVTCAANESMASGMPVKP